MSFHAATTCIAPTLITACPSQSPSLFVCAQVASLDWCKGPDRGLPAPDIVFYLHLSADQAQARAEYGVERYEKTAFQKVHNHSHAYSVMSWGGGAISNSNASACCLKSEVE